MEPRILSDGLRSNFVNNKDAREIPEVKYIKIPSSSIEEIQGKVNQQITDEKKRRKIGIYLVRKYSGKKLNEIAEYYGRISDAGVSRLYLRMENERKQNRRLDELISVVEKMLNVET